MRSTAIFFIACIAVAASVSISDRLQAKMTTHFGIMNQIQSVRGDSKLGSMLMSLAEVHMTVGGPVDELVTAIKALDADLVKKAAKEQQEFETATVNHNNRVTQLEALIASAKSDVENSANKLENVLYPRRQSLEETIQQLKDNIKNNKETWANEDAQRTRENNLYNERSSEHKQVLDALAEATVLVKSLQNGSASFIQISAAKNSLKRLTAKLNKSSFVNAPLVQALIMVSQNFSDQDAVSKVLNLLEQLRVNTVNSQADYTATEEAAAAAWVKRSAELKAELADFESRLAARELDLKNTKAEIKKTEEFKAARQRDFNRETQNLKEENENWEQLVATHKDMVAQFKKERQTVADAVKLLQDAGAQLRDYIKEAANKA